MAFTEVSAAHEDSVHALLKGAQDVVRGNTGGTHHSYHANVGRILQTTDPSQVSSSICSPGAEETYDLGLNIRRGHAKSSLFVFQRWGGSHGRCLRSIPHAPL